MAKTDEAVTAIREGAVDYLTKPLDVELLLQAVRRALDGWRVVRSVSSRERGDAFASLVGACPAMQRVLDRITPSDAANCFEHCGYSLRLG